MCERVFCQTSSNDEDASERRLCFDQRQSFPSPTPKKTRNVGKRVQDVCLPSMSHIIMPVERDLGDDDFFMKWLWGERVLMKECKLTHSTALDG